MPIQESEGGQVSQDELYQWIADQECNVPPDEAPNVAQFVQDVLERMEQGSWKRLKAQLEVDDE
jgi:hypothetical protein